MIRCPPPARDSDVQKALRISKKQSMPSPTNKSSSSRPTMGDVAKACGIARSTVSGILNHRADCYASAETRKRVLEAVRKMGYRPSRTAMGLVSGRTSTLGIIHTGGELETAARICVSFGRRAYEHGYMSVVAFNPNEPGIEDTQLDKLDDRGIDGVFVMPSEEGNHDSLRQLAERGMPVVTLDGIDRISWADEVPIDDVSCNHYRGGQIQAEHLIAVGKRQLVIADLFHTCHVAEQRVAGMMAAVEEAGLPQPVRMGVPFEVHPMETWTADAARYVERFFQERVPDADGVMATGDHLAYAVAGMLLRIGKTIPNDIAVIGHDSQSFGAQPILPLSSVGLPAHEMGTAACDLLVQRLNTSDPVKEPHRLKFNPRLISRASTVGPENVALNTDSLSSSVI